MTSRVSKSNYRNISKQIQALLGGIMLYVFLVIIWAIGYQLAYAGRIFPGVTVAGIDISGMTPNDAAFKLSQMLSFPNDGKIVFRTEENIWIASPTELGMVFDPTASAMTAYQSGRSGNLISALMLQIESAGRGIDLPPKIIFDQRVAYNYLQIIAVQINQPVIDANLSLEGTDVVSRSGQIGRALNIDATMIYLDAQLQSFRDGEVPLIVQQITPRIIDVASQVNSARNILSKPLILTVPNHKDGDPGPWTYDIPVLAKMLIANIELVDNRYEMKVGLDPTSLRIILNDLKVYVDRQPANARFVFNDETRLIEPIRASEVGRVLDVDASILAINEALLRGEHKIEIVVFEQQPKVADNAIGAEIGITELVAQGTTYFYGSSAERIQNITAAAERFHGVLVAPNETFSMGAYLGDISLENGFAEALIIYGGRTIKGVGGGVCQVSTTLFRTVFLGGYPIVERYSHAYRVSYYEKTINGGIDPNLAGIDATVYFPLVDFKFLNDTPYWMLMETYVDDGKITWKIYSTSDGRTVAWDTTGPINTVPPPAPVFEENAELEADQIKQVDFAAQGAEIIVNRTVWRNGQIYFADKFQTQYEPWAAVCQYGPGTIEPEKQANKNGLCLSRNNQ